MRMLIGLAAVVALAACSANDPADNQPEPVALVSLAPVTQNTLAEKLTLYGAVENGAFGRHVLATPVEAKVVAIDAPVGAAVRAGQVVARLAPSPASRLDLAKAASDATAAQSAYARAQRLRADGLASDADVETTRAAAQSAAATHATLSANTLALALRAPASGYVETVSFAPGDLVPAGSAVVALAGSGPLRARFGIDPALATRLRAGMTLSITTPSGTTLDLPIQSVDPVVDPQTRLASAFSTIPAGAGVGANATLTAQISLAGGGKALSTPYAALLDDAGQPYVFVVANGVAHRRNVELGPIDGDRVAIIKGLKLAERVVTAGGTALEDGMKVRTK